jgi:hypothetical protein
MDQWSECVTRNLTSVFGASDVRRFPRSLRFAYLLLAAAWLAGCDKKQQAHETVPVSGVVRFKGTPLTKGTVTLQPINDGSGLNQRPAIGEIDAGGAFTLSTFTAGDGALPGNYHVLVTCYRNAPTVEEYAQGVKRESLIPERYSNALTSGQTREIPEKGGPIQFDIDLTE